MEDENDVEEENSIMQTRPPPIPVYIRYNAWRRRVSSATIARIGEFYRCEINNVNIHGFTLEHFGVTLAEFTIESVRSHVGEWNEGEIEQLRLQCLDFNVILGFARDDSLTPSSRRQNLGESTVRYLMLSSVGEFIRCLNNRLHVVRFVALGDEDCCAICLNENIGSLSVTVTCCRTNFHRNCLQTWFSQSRTCPICRAV